MVPENPSVCYRCKTCKLCFLSMPEITHHLTEANHFIRQSPNKALARESFRTPDPPTSPSPIVNESHPVPKETDLISSGEEDNPGAAETENECNTTNLPQPKPCTSFHNSLQLTDPNNGPSNNAGTSEEGTTLNDNERSILNLTDQAETKQNAAESISEKSLRGYCCRKCGETFIAPGQVRIHMKQVHSVTRVIGVSKKDTCGTVKTASPKSAQGSSPTSLYSLRSLNIRKRRKVVEDGIKKNEESKYIKNVKRHTKFTCRHCFKSFPLLNGLKLHIHKTHPEVTPSRKPGSVGPLRKSKHKLRPTNQPNSKGANKSATIASQRPPQKQAKMCHHCKKEFKFARQLRSHLKVCTTKSDLQCQKCGKAYKNSYFFENHKCSDIIKGEGKNIDESKYLSLSPEAAIEGPTLRKSDNETNSPQHSVESEDYRRCWICGFVVTRFHNLKKHFNNRHKIEISVSDILAKKSELS